MHLKKAFKKKEEKKALQQCSSSHVDELQVKIHF
jgi:hypothetical protein